jgi:hypothetical protein
MKAVSVMKTGLGVLALVALSSGASQATTLAIYDGVAAGKSAFDSTVSGAGGTVAVDALSGLVGGGTSIDRGAYTITRNDGSGIFATFYGTLSGEVIGINPSTTGAGGSLPRTDPLDYFAGGLTFTFDSAINALGFEVGDWATCCFEPTTDLFISFDDGTPIQVGTADEEADGEFPSQSPGVSSAVNEIFVAAFDDSGSFTKVSFWGNGIGEFLVAGGALRYALIDEGSLPPTGVVPVPAAGLMLLTGLGGMAAFRRRRAA